MSQPPEPTPRAPVPPEGTGHVWGPPAFPRMVHRRNVPPIFRNALRYRAIWQSEADTNGGLNDWELDVLQTQAEMFVKQVGFRPELGMTWRLSWLEEEMGLPDGHLTGLSDQARRDRICGRLRSWRVPTNDAIKAVAEAYAGAEVQVVMDYEAHHITVIFRAVPENLLDLQAEIIRLIPARLGISFLIIYITWGDATEVGLIWCQPETGVPPEHPQQGDLPDGGWTWDYWENSGRDFQPTSAQCPPANP
jgi:hypothetical protein